MATRTANAKWQGTLQGGSGTMALGSGAWSGQFSFKSRFADGEGTNPEELIGAALAGCYSMQLSLGAEQAGHTPESIETEASVHLTPADGGGFEISRIELSTRGQVRGIDAEEFTRLAEEAKRDCLIHKALAGVGAVNLDAALIA